MCRRRVVPLMVRFPPFGGGQVAVRGGVVPKVQTHWVKAVKNRPLRLNGSAFSAKRRRLWCAQAG